MNPVQVHKLRGTSIKQTYKNEISHCTYTSNKLNVHSENNMYTKTDHMAHSYISYINKRPKLKILFLITKEFQLFCFFFNGHFTNNQRTLYKGLNQW